MKASREEARRHARGFRRALLSLLCEVWFLAWLLECSSWFSSLLMVLQVLVSAIRHIDETAVVIAP